jgi:autoinducer 2-degrading protein
MDVIALFVSLRIKPEQQARFLEAVEDDSTCSVRDEPGCLRFDVLQDSSDPYQYYFYEIYRDEQALAEHQQTAHYARWAAAREACIAEPPTRVRASVVLPTDPARWALPR